MQLSATYDVAIIGGGLAGLAAAIQLSKSGYAVVLLEKETYPFHKVCGEYISMESWDFLQRLGVPLTHMQLPEITTLQLTSPNGKAFTTPLPLGGFGISRYRLDNLLADIAKQNGVTIVQATKATDVQYDNDAFGINYTSSQYGSGKIQSAICCGAFGKRSNLDVKWKRTFIQNKASRINNYVGVKYHIRTQWPEHLIGLHNFSGGYCGISKIEGDEYCLCYMTTAIQLKNCNNSIPQLQQQILYQNPHLKNIFSNSEIVNDFPITISQISFDKKSPVEQHIVMLGDAASMITPLCGNGMSMALHSSKIAASLIVSYLQKKISFAQLEQQYSKQWKAAFAARMQTGRILQRFFGNNRLSNAFVQTFQLMPFLAKGIIKKTHGTAF